VHVVACVSGPSHDRIKQKSVLRVIPVTKTGVKEDESNVHKLQKKCKCIRVLKRLEQVVLYPPMDGGSGTERRF